MRTLGIGLGGVLVILIVGSFVAPALVERNINTFEPSDLPEPSAHARALHAKAPIVDLHDDLLLWERDPLERATRGHTDVPRLREGGMRLQVLAAVTKSPFGQNFERNSADAADMITLLVALQRWPMRTWGSLHQRALHIADRARDAAERSEGAVRFIRSREDVDALLNDLVQGRDAFGVLLASEGMHPLEAELANVDAMFDAGYRMLAPTHFFDNAVGGSAHGEEKGGLTPFGERAIDRMQERSMVVDLAHASPATVDDVLARATKPVVVSHTGVQATCPGPRNLSDAHVRAIARNGGVMGIGFFDGAVCDISPEGIVAAMRHVADLVGVEHVALGSDWNGATRVRIDATRVVHLTDAMLRAGFSDDDVRAILGGNALRLLRAGLPAN